MSSIAEKRRRKNRANITRGETTPDTHDDASGKENRQDMPTARPTPERWARGMWAEAQGAGKDARPLVDLSSDLIGRLYAERKITSSQHEAARRFQEVRDAFMLELGTVGYRSCLAGGCGGYDSGDGDVSVAQAYRALSERLGPHLRVMVDNCHKLGDERATDLEALIKALDVLAN